VSRPPNSTLAWLALAVAFVVFAIVMFGMAR